MCSAEMVIDRTRYHNSYKLCICASVMTGLVVNPEGEQMREVKSIRYKNANDRKWQSRHYKRPDVVSCLDLASRSEMLAKAGRV